MNAFINSERWAASNQYRYVAYAAAAGLSNGLTGPQEAQTWQYYKADNFFGINGGICDKYVTATIKTNWLLGSLPKPIPVDRSKLINPLSSGPTWKLITRSRDLLASRRAGRVASSRPGLLFLQSPKPMLEISHLQKYYGDSRSRRSATST